MHTSTFRSAVTCFIGILLIVICLVKESGSMCPGTPDRSVKYVAIDEADYDRNYSSITSEGKRPLGFDKTIWYYNQKDVSSPCINISNVGSKFLEIKFETFPSSRLCVKIPGAQAECSDPGTGRLSVCRKPIQDTVYVEFTCDSQCTESDVQFWYRLTLGVNYEEDPEERWCNERPIEYPEDLQKLPSDVPLNSYNPKPDNVASTISASVSLFPFILSFVAVRFL